MQTLTRNEALKAMIDGAKITHPEYDEGEFSYYHPGACGFIRDTQTDKERGYPKSIVYKAHLSFIDGYRIKKEGLSKKHEAWVALFKDGDITWRSHSIHPAEEIAAQEQMYGKLVEIRHIEWQEEV